MEKYSQYRDRGSGISPFIPHTTPTSTVSLIFHTFIFLFRLPIFIGYSLLYFVVLTHLPLPVVVRKLLLWGLLGIPGIWWVDLQLDGVKRGSLSQQPSSRVPHPRSVIASSSTSPIDALYLAAIFDPIFTVSYPGTQKVARVSLLRAILLALAPVQTAPPKDTSHLATLQAIMNANPHRVIAVFPECGTTNGKGILPFSTSLLSAPADASIFPLSMRYTPQDITTPVPGLYFTFIWNLLSRPTHCIRVRIAEGVTNASTTNTLSSPGDSGYASGSSYSAQGNEDDKPTPEEQRTLDRISEALARLARNKRVGLTLRDKFAFVEAWSKGRT